MILGLNDPWHDSNFCLYSPQGIIHIELERFTRSKYEQMNPVLGFITQYPELIGSIDGFAIEEGEFLAPHVRRLLTAGDDGIDEFVSRIAAQSLGSIQFKRDGANAEVDVLRRFAKQLLLRSASTRFYGHHLCHAADAFFASNFSEALSITLDGGGIEVIAGKKTTVHGSVWQLSRNMLEVPPPILLETAQSIGLGWHRIRDLFDLREGEEGTVMAMAAFGKQSSEMDAIVANDLLWVPMAAELAKPLARSLNRYLKSVAAVINSEDDKFSLALALQRETEVRIRRFLDPYLENYMGDLCLSGGVFLNCQVTGKIKSWYPGIRDIYIPPAPYDGGISVGAAQLFAHCNSTIHMADGSARSAEFAPFATGRTYSRIDIIGAIRAHGCDFEVADFDEIARRLSNGEVLGLFQGAAESGRRALGHRSIIADPRKLEMKQRINSLIKHRQWFRPFAPMVLADDAAEWFEIEPGAASPYMSFAVSVRPEKRELIPAVVHQDGTARVQTVYPKLMPTTYRLLQSWKQCSGIPVLLNTSFNDHEPIVQQPSEALATFLRIPLDGVYFADFEILVVRRSQQPGSSPQVRQDEKTASLRSVDRLINRFRRKPHSLK